MLTYTFDYNLSRLCDIINFPETAKLLISYRHSSDIEPEMIDEFHSEIIAIVDKHTDWLNELDIEGYGSCNPFKFDALYYMIEREHIKTYEALKAYILNMPLSELRYLFFEVLLYDQGNNQISNSEQQKIRDIVKDSNQWLPTIDANLITGDEKWRYYNLVNNPHKEAARYFDWIEEVKDDVEALINSKQNYIKKQGTELQNVLNKKGLAYLDECFELYSMTSVNFHKMLSDAHQSVRVLVSATMSTHIALQTSYKQNQGIMILGTHWQTSLERLKELKEKKLDDKIAIFKNLGDPTRYKVFKSILEGADNNKDLAKKIGVSSATVSYHLNQLILAKLLKYDVDKSRFGYEVNYAFITKHLNEFIDSVNSNYYK